METAVVSDARFETVDPVCSTDDAVVARVLAGDVQAFEVLIRRYNQRLYRLARSIVSDDHAAWDVVQESYLRAYTSLATFRGPDGFATWLYVIVRNQALTMLRQSKREAPTETGMVESMLDDEGGPQQSTPERALETQRLRESLEAAIGKLPRAFRVVFVLRAVEGMSAAETARILDLNEKTVKTRYFRAKRMLRERFGRQLRDASAQVYQFAGAHCDTMTAEVMARISARGPLDPV